MPSRPLRDSSPQEHRRAILLSVQLPGIDDEEHQASVRELERLVSTLGYEVLLTISQKRDSLAPAAVLGEGKLAELAELTGGTGKTNMTLPKRKDKARQRREATERESSRHVGAATDEDEGDEDDEKEGHKKEAREKEARFELIAVDHDITPSQARNLERATGVTVLDRTGVIVEIFHRHARSREAKLQVEIARLNYTAPRVRESPHGKERQQGRGSGEAALELDRRKIRDRVAELHRELLAVQKEQDNRRAHRREARRVALVGYTNAGKSSLMRGLTGSSVLVEDKLFATLDTTVRALHPEVRPRILVSDTVGFIKKLPHDLVASFKSTLDEALEASLLVHVVDASDPTFPSQYQVTRDVLEEIGVADAPSLLVLNKADLVDPARAALLRGSYPGALLVSAHEARGIAEVRAAILHFFEATYEEEVFFVPYAEQARIAEMHGVAHVVEETYEDLGARVRVRADRKLLDRLARKLGAPRQSNAPP